MRQGTNNLGLWVFAFYYSPENASIGALPTCERGKLNRYHHFRDRRVFELRKRIGHTCPPHGVTDSAGLITSIAGANDEWPSAFKLNPYPQSIPGTTPSTTDSGSFALSALPLDGLSPHFSERASDAARNVVGQAPVATVFALDLADPLGSRPAR